MPALYFHFLAIFELQGNVVAHVQGDLHDVGQVSYQRNLKFLNLLVTTTIRLMPMFQVEQKTIDYRIADLLKAMAEMIRRIDDGQSGVIGITERLESVLNRLDNEHSDVKADLTGIRQLLREGFRLPGEDAS